MVINTDADVLRVIRENPRLIFQVLREDEELLDEVRRLVLTEEILAMPGQLAEVIETQKAMLKDQAEMRQTQNEMLETQAKILADLADLRRTQNEMLKTQTNILADQAEMRQTQNEMLTDQADLKKEHDSDAQNSGENGKRSEQNGWQAGEPVRRRPGAQAAQDSPVTSLRYARAPPPDRTAPRRG